VVVQLRQSIRGASNPWGAVKDTLANLVEVVNAATGSTLSLEKNATQAGATGLSAGTILTKGAGVSAAESYAVGIQRSGTLVKTRIVVDLTGLVGSASDTDIIGNTGGAASAHWGRLTVALNGTIIGGVVTCLEVPAGGATDINFYSANESTGAQDALATSLTETVLIDSGGAWTSGLSKGMTTVPPANDYLYIANGAASGGTFTAGKFLIELFGYAA
jgi:hypothetical protein